MVPQQYLGTKDVFKTQNTREYNYVYDCRSKEERIAAWSFIFYDKNKNKFLDKAEWKAFKDAMSLVKNLKRCGKKLPRYCDINKDRSISLTEWQNCLNANQHQVTCKYSIFFYSFMCEMIITIHILCFSHIKTKSVVYTYRIE